MAWSWETIALIQTSDAPCAAASVEVGARSGRHGSLCGKVVPLRQGQALYGKEGVQ